MFYISRYDSQTGLYNTVMFSFSTILGFLVTLNSVTAAPTILLEQRADADTTSSTTKIWVPILVIVFALLLLLTFAIKKWVKTGTALPRALSSFSRAAAIGTGAVPPTTELTADQLTGSTTNTTTSAANTTSTRARRPRRTRRTPSQISTISLPVYMKEPGEQELVVIRGPQDMEDVPIEEGEMPAVHEDDATDERYSPMPDSPNDMPLLEGDESADVADQSSAALLPEAHEEPRARSIHVGSSRHSADSSSLLRVDTNLSNSESPDPRGAAPAYFEVVDLGDEQQRPPISLMPSSPPSAAASGTSTAPTAASGRSSNRRSLRNLFHFSASRTPLVPPPPPGLPVTSETSHARSESGGALSLTSTPSRPSTSYAGHRPSQSSSSVFSLAKPLSRKKSTATLNSNHLTSPSLISLASISAPLTHTLVRTEFTYPKAGPTPEQVKLISSREAFARFGVPYGADAIAFAASTQDLNPPPEFEENPVAAGSRARSQSRATQASTTGASTSDAGLGHSGELGGRSSESSGESNGTNASSSLNTPEIRVHESSRPATPSIEPYTPATTVEASSPTRETDEDQSKGKSSELYSLPSIATLRSPAAVEEKPTPESPKDILVSPIDLEGVPAPSKEQQTSSPQTSTKDPADPVSISPSHPAPTVPHASTAASSSTSSRPPPSSFRKSPPSDPSAPSLRSESRASSFRSFATANESVTEFGVKGNTDASATSDTEYYSEQEYYSDQGTEVGDGDTRPPTPTTPTRSAAGAVFLEGHRMSHHALEGTDTTVRAAA
ncbi:hypothetical protein D9757_001720 [Collybiopsis confluens]|uniref:Proteophosphoglycan ppg4 n=1 Tax=Collybiopsis confluens TaxID=2823264 RepID=A0A8H5HZD7_9AGAR|nr:hypothetical protein D9757_001720 [Collybiopsis confluens]